MAKDKCVLCGVETPYDETTHIDLRQGYVEGSGQVCKGCWDKTYPTAKAKNEGFLTIPRRMVLDFPNDQMLGEEIRRLFYQTQ
jgi:hypothetical protein